MQARLGAVNSCACLTLLPAMRLVDVQPIHYGDVLVDTGLIDSTPELDDE